MHKSSFSPKAFLKGRRPERFSDTVQVEAPSVERAILEYHLEVLTNKKQETPFEEFARALAQREICPNLLPQTGPTGGGDSKVDAETYPTASVLTWTWYAGVDREAAKERWAFAFSAKREWRAKLKSDIGAIASTQRGYTKAFFITNQYVADRKRAALEDELTKQHGIDIRILDRSWILDRVFTNNHEDLVATHLGIGEVRSVSVTGPRDTERGRELEEVEQRLRTLSQAESVTPVAADLALRALILSRELEKSDVELRGRIAVAIDLADRYGNAYDRFEARYESAWTYFWWLEDVQSVVELYIEIERALVGTRNAHELELMTNLWFLIHASVQRNDIDAKAADLKVRTKRLRKELKRLAAEPHLPSASLLAQTLDLHVQLAMAPGDDAVRRRVIAGLTNVVRRSAGLVGYPLESLVNLYLEVGENLEGTKGYDELFEVLVSTWAARKGEVEAAQLLLIRGAKQLDNGRPLDAIATIGRAQNRLYKHESRHDLVRALYLAGIAYHRVGLLWAARGALINAASVASAELWTYGDITNAQLACYEKLRWLELELGRLPQLLCWHELTQVCAAALASSGNAADISDRDTPFDAILGMLLLRLDLWSLARLQRLPDTLDELQLVNAAVALRWALGENHLPTEFAEVVEPTGDNQTYFSLWLEQPAAAALRQVTELGLEQRTTLESWVLGCQVMVSTDRSSPAVELSESLLAALESFLATGPLHKAVAYEPSLSIDVRISEFADPPFSFAYDEDSVKPRFNVTCTPFDVSQQPLNLQQRIKERLSDLLIAIISKIVFASDVREWLRTLFADEEGMSRSVNFTGSMISVTNVLGDEPRLSIADWQPESRTQYLLTRAAAWQPTSLEERPSEGRKTPRPAPSGDPPKELFDPNRMSHRSMRTYSLIREKLWDSARWTGIFFMWRELGDEPPVLALMFKDPENATYIFQNWREELGTNDSESKLRVSIIRGVNRSHPAYYRVTVGSDPFSDNRLSGPSWALSVLRYIEMNPETTRNLDAFLERYETVGEYLLAPAAILPGDQSPTAATRLGILKRDLLVREAWQVGRHDLDSVAIHEDDKPIVPEDEPNAPIAELLALKRSGGRRPRKRQRRRQ